MKLRRILSAALALVMILSVTAFAPATVKAAPAAPDCNGHDGWIELSRPEDFDDTSKFDGVKSGDIRRWPKKNGKYYLSADITLPEARAIFGYANDKNDKQDFTICLNGHTLNAGDCSNLTYTSNGTTGLYGFIQMQGTSSTYKRTFNLCDCAGGGKLIANPTSAAAPTNYRAVIAIYQYGTVNWYGGTICDSYAAVSGYGGVIRVQGTQGVFNMYDGTKIENVVVESTGTVTAKDVVVYGAGKFNMYGGEIIDTDTRGSGSIRLHEKATGSVNLYGGTITATDGGVAIANQCTSTGTVNVYGGTFNGAATGTVKYGVTVNGAQLTSTDSATPGTVATAGGVFTTADSTLTLTDPARVNSLAWSDGMALTVKLDADCSTDVFSTVSEGRELTLDLNGHTLTAPSGITVAGTLTVADTSADAEGALLGSVTTTGAGVLNDPQDLIPFPVRVNGARLTKATSSGAGYAYDHDSATLTVSDPSKITALDWEAGFELTVKLAADWMTDLFASVAAGQKLILDLNGHTLNAGYVVNAGELTVTDTSGTHGAVNGTVRNVDGGALHNPLSLPIDMYVTYPVQVNGTTLDAVNAAGEGYSYDPASATLTVTDPTKVTALEWDGALTVKLGADWATGLFHGIPEGKELTLDLNGHAFTAEEGITNSGTLTVTDTSGTPGTFSGTVTNVGAAVLNDPLSLVTVSGTVTYHVRVNGTAVTSATVNGDGFTYDPLSGVLAVSDPGKITALDWDADAYLTLKLGADWDTSVNFDPFADFAGKSLTLDLNGHVIGKAGYSAVDGESASAPVQNDLTVSGTLTVMDSTAATVDGIAGIGEGTLKGYTVTVTGSGSKLTLEGGIITDGYKSGTGSSDGGGAVRVENSGSFTMNGGRITACYGHNGGAVFVYNGTFTMNNGRIDHNASGRFGAICAGSTAGTTNLNGGLIDHNETVSSDSNARGGAVACVGGAVKFGAVTIDSNKARVTGGAIYFYSSKTYTMNGTVIKDNETTAGSGGAIYVASQAVTLNATNVTFDGNKAVGSSKNGGALCADGSTGSLNFTNCTFTNNSAAGVGGAVSAAKPITMTGCTVEGNKTTGSGKAGGAFVASGKLTLNNCTVKDNTATGIGGGFYIESSGSVTLTDTTVTGNTGTYGGGVYAKGMLTLNSGSISGNTGTSYAAELYIGPAGGGLTMYDGVIGVKGKTGTGQSYTCSLTSSGTTSSPAVPVAVTIYGGTLYCGLTMQGDKGADVKIYGGNVHSLNFNTSALASSTVKVYGGKFVKADYLSTYFAADDLEIGNSTDPYFTYMVAPKAEYDFTLSEDGSSVTASMSSAESAWTFYTAGTAETSVVAPATATFKFGGRTVSGLALTDADGRYSVTVPVTESDYGKEYELTVFDASGASIRYFTGGLFAATRGDVNGDNVINVHDLVTVKRHVAGGYGVALATEVGDVNGDGEITAKDATKLARYIVGGYGETVGKYIPSELPTGVYAFSSQFRNKSGEVSFTFRGTTYRATIGLNAFGHLDDLTKQATEIPTEPFCGNTYDTPVAIVTAGVHKVPDSRDYLSVDLARPVTIVGEAMGVSPNDPTDVTRPNPARNMQESVLKGTTYYGIISLGENISDGYLTLDGLTLQNASARDNRLSGEHLGLEVKNCIFEGTFYRDMIITGHATVGQQRHLNVSDCRVDGLGASGAANRFILARGGEVTVERLYYAHTKKFFGMSDYAITTNNAKEGAWLDVTLRDCVFEDADCVHGITVKVPAGVDHASVTAEDCTFKNFASSGDPTFMLTAPDDSFSLTLRRCTVAGKGDAAILIDGSQNAPVTLEETTVTGYAATVAYKPPRRTEAPDKIGQVVWADAKLDDPHAASADTATALAKLDALYAGRSVRFGDMHTHTNSGGTSDGSVPLATFVQELRDLNLDFAAIVDHKQILHTQLPEWDSTLLIPGTEPGTNIAKPGADSLSMHYCLIFRDPQDYLITMKAFPEFKYDGGNGLMGHNVYPNFTRQRMCELVEFVYDLGGVVSQAHPVYQMGSEDPEDYRFTDHMQFDTIYSSGGSSYNTLQNVRMWETLLKKGDRLITWADSDTHAHAKTTALTSVYTTTAGDPIEVFDTARTGDCSAGCVGIQMSIDDTPMGGHLAYRDGLKLAIRVKDYYAAEMKADTVYSLKVYTDQGLAYASEFDGTQTQELVIPVQPRAYYRVEIFNESDNAYVALSNPIWLDY